MTLAELQKIADEVGEAFSGRKWKVVVRKWGGGVAPLSFFRRVLVGRRFLQNPDLAEFRFRVALGRAYHQSHSRSVVYRIMVCLIIAIPLAFIVGISMPHIFAFDFRELLVILVVVYTGIADFWLPWHDRNVIGSDAFLTRVLELSQHPEALRAHLLQAKASPETLAKFDAMAKAMDVPAQG